MRHGRAGQRQAGVDIVGRNGALYPVSLQCKRRTQWPVRSLTNAEIDAEVAAALTFTPSLKAFYILTTAPDDARLQAHVRDINARHKTAKRFEVILLGWGEIVRRATLDRAVADKHFGMAGGHARSPLLATWFTSRRRLEKTGRELAVSVEELALDLHDWPMGHIVVREHESDALLERLRPFEGRQLTLAQRQTRIALRKQLRVTTDTEARIVRGVTLMLSDPDLSGWILKVWEEDGERHHVRDLADELDDEAILSALDLDAVDEAAQDPSASVCVADRKARLGGWRLSADRLRRGWGEPRRISRRCRDAGFEPGRSLLQLAELRLQPRGTITPLTALAISLGATAQLSGHLEALAC